MPYTPRIGGALAAGFEVPFGNEPISSLSMAVTVIEMLANDETNNILSHATGFFWRCKTGVYLISARHVFSGTDPFTDEAISPELYVPERIKVYPTIESEGNFGRLGIIFGLRTPTGASWVQDPEFSSLKTDIAALRVFDADFKVICVNDDAGNFTPMISHIGFDCFVLGYPTRELAGLMTPIWRRGTLASEPMLPVDNKPMFLLDASTSPGFSGAPVFRRHVGPLPVREQNGSIQIKGDSVLATCFVGVYAGRLKNRHVGGEVPFVFYGNRISHIVA